jgi:hypothetical protein
VTEPTSEDRSFAASLLDGLSDVGDTWEHQVEYVARRVADAREAARVEQLREAARVLTDRAAVMERGR